ncbi:MULTISPECIES: hypothetical protein [unclassified Streptomyces]|uniref:hypothetical protein n=1 Tax=unclassified Streptomyces TaxID=2593676 RepID=UPI00163D5AA8|nr:MULTISPECIES: hypothetical protein [unclassified Streptomyces]
MSHPVPTCASVRPSERLAGTPAVRRDGHWWLITPTGTMPASDPVFTGELNRFAADMAAADRAVAKLRTERTAARKDRR